MASLRHLPDSSIPTFKKGDIVECVDEGNYSCTDVGVACEVVNDRGDTRYMDVKILAGEPHGPECDGFHDPYDLENGFEVVKKNFRLKYRRGPENDKEVIDLLNGL